MEELYEPVSDPWILKYLNLTNPDQNASYTPSGHTAHSRHISSSKAEHTTFPTPPTSTFLQRFLPRSIRTSLSRNFPFYPNLTPAHFIPTQQLRLFQLLFRHFPLHRLIISDFSSLPNTIDESISTSSSGIFSPSLLGFNKSRGKNSPVVQTRIKGEMVPVTKFTVQQGYFDIFFPTDFEEMRDVYQKVMRGESRDEDLGLDKSVDERHSIEKRDENYPGQDQRVKTQRKVKSQFDSEDIRAREQSLESRFRSMSRSRSEPRSSPLETRNSLRSDYFLKTTPPSSSNTFFSPHTSDLLATHQNGFPLSFSHGQERSRSGTGRLKIMDHSEFLQRYAEVEKTRLKDGSNPMVTWYQNAKWFLT